MTVVPNAVVVYAFADTPTVLTIRNGKKPFNVYSSNTAIISFNPTTMPGGLIADEFITLEGPSGNFGRVNNVDADTTVTLTIRDAEGTQVQAVVTVKPSSLNTTLTTTDPVNAGTQGQASVKATSITGAPLPGHVVRFRVTDQGAAYGFVCNQTLGGCTVAETDLTGRIIAVDVTTDRNGDANAVIRADVGASTQYATISATDMSTGHVLRKQFTIAGLALAVLPGTATWTITGIGNADTIAGNGFTSLNCSGAVTSFFVYGGTPPYTITTTAPNIATVGGATTTTVASSGGTFNAAAACSVANPTQGTANIVIADAAGAILSTVTFVVTITEVDP